MDNYYLKQTSFTPSVSFDFNHGFLKISGNLYPDNPCDFFNPISDYILNMGNFFEVDAKLTINIYIINASSHKSLLCLIKKLTELYKTLTVEWVCEFDDTDNIETGYIYKDILKTPVDIVILSECGDIQTVLH